MDKDLLMEKLQSTRPYSLADRQFDVSSMDVGHCLSEDTHVEWQIDVDGVQVRVLEGFAF